MAANYYHPFPSPNCNQKAILLLRVFLRFVQALPGFQVEKQLQRPIELSDEAHGDNWQTRKGYQTFHILSEFLTIVEQLDIQHYLNCVRRANPVGSAILQIFLSTYSMKMFF